MIQKAYFIFSKVRPFGNICSRCGLFVLQPQPDGRNGSKWIDRDRIDS